MTTPIRVGITGGIGSGKSIVCGIFNCLGIPIYYSDFKAKELMTKDQKLIDKIKLAFGSSSYDNNGNLNRTYLRQMVFSSPKQLAILNGIVHPRIMVNYNEWVNSHLQYDYVINETALLFESGKSQSMDKIITVFSPEPLKIKNTMKRDLYRTEADVKAIINNQLPDEEKAKKADYVIYNDNSQMLIPQVLQIHALLV